MSSQSISTATVPSALKHRAFSVSVDDLIEQIERSIPEHIVSPAAIQRGGDA